MPEIWRKCSSCKKDILTNQKYFVCSISTCRGAATNYAFCSINCWDAHLPIERHRSDNAGALEKQSPKDLASAATEATNQPKKILPSGSSAKSSVEDDVLVVVSKVRKYIADKSGLNTSASAYEALTEKIKQHCDRAINEARSQGRKTVMDRDF